MQINHHRLKSSQPQGCVFEVFFFFFIVPTELGEGIKIKSDLETKFQL